MGDSFDNIVEVLTFGAASELMKSGQEDPKPAPVQAPPVTMQDTNVREAASRKSRQLAAASRSRSRQVSEPGSTLGY